MKVAIIAEVYLPKVDGVVGRTVNLIRQLQSLGDEVLVVCPKVSQPRNSPAAVVEFRGFPCASYPEYVIGIPDESLVTQLKMFQPDVIHFLNPFAFGFQCFDVISRSDLSIPTVFSFHTLYGEFVKQYRGLRPLSRLLWWLTRSYHNTAMTNLTVSVPMQDELRERGFRNVELWPPAVDCNLYSPSRKTYDMRCRLSGNHPESPLLLTVSRLASEKNVSFLTQVMDRLPNARLAIVGGGPQEEELRRQFAKYPAEFVGYLRGEELAAAYASADAFVYASETETMGNVILEAMACGLPVVAAAAGGVPSLVQHGVDGFLYKPRCGKEAAGYVSQLMTSRTLREQMSAAAVDSTSRRTWRDSAMAVRNQYQQAIQQHSAVDVTKSRSPLAARLCTSALVRLFQLAAPSDSTPNAPEFSPARPRTA